MIRKITKQLKANSGKLITLGDQGLVSGVNFIIGILLARFLGIDQYGLFALAWMAVLFASSLHQSIFVASLFALLPSHKNGTLFIRQLYSGQFVFSLLIFLFIALAGGLALPFFPEWGNLSFILVVAGTAAIYVLNDFLRRVAFARHNPSIALAMDGSGYGLQPILILLLYYFDQLNLIHTLLIILFLQMLSSIIGTYLLRLSPTLTGWRTTALSVLRYSKYLIGTSILQWLSGNFYTLTAAGVLGPIAVGAIRIAQNILGVMHVLLLGMENFIPVRAAEQYHAKGLSGMVHYLARIFAQVAIPFIGALLLIALFREKFIVWIYGWEYAPYTYVLLAFCGIYVLVFIGTQLRFLIRTVERNQLIFWSYVLTSIVSVLTADFLVSQYGIAGVLTGIAITQIIMLSFYVLSLKKELQWLVK